MSEYEGYTEARKNAAMKYQSENLEQIRLWVKKEKKAEYKAKAAAKGKSLRAYIIDLIENDAP